MKLKNLLLIVLLFCCFEGKAQAGIDAFKDGVDLVYYHFEAPDECGHQGNADKKKLSVELIDEKVVKTAQLEFGPKDATFHIYCSVENLKFLGDEMPVNDNFAKYNFVTFVPEGKKK